MAMKPYWVCLAALACLAVGILALQSLTESKESQRAAARTPSPNEPVTPGASSAASEAPAPPAATDLRQAQVDVVPESAPLVTRVERRAEPAIAIVGRVQDESGNAIAAATVDLRAGERRRTQTDLDGRFCIPVGPDASGSLVVDHAGHAGTVIHHVQPGAELSITLKHGVDVRGQARDARSGQGIPDVLVFALTKTMPPRLATSDAQGHFVLRDLGDEPVLVQAVHLGYEAASESCETSREEVEIKLFPGEPFTGVVVDELSSLPIEGARVTCTMQESVLGEIWFASAPPVPSAVQVTGADGRFRFPQIGLPAARVRVTADRYVPFEMEGSDWQPGHERIVLKQPLAIHGTVVTAGGDEASGTEISYRLWVHGLSTKRVAVMSDADGAFTLADIDPYQDLELFARHADCAPALVKVDLTAARRAPICIVLGAGARIQGRLVTADHTPMAHIDIEIETASSDEDTPGQELALAFAGSGQCPTDDDGGFLITGIPPGDYRLESRSSPRVRQAVSIAAGEKKELTLVMAALAPIQGRCLDQDDRALSSVSISAEQEGEGPTAGAVEYVEVDDQGRFVLTAFGAGARVRITASHEAYAASSLIVDAGSSDVVVRMVASARLVGRALDAVTQEPVRSLTAELSPFDSPKGIEVHADGSFLVEGLGLSDYRLTVVADGYAPKTMDIRLTKAEQEVVVLLDRADLWGTVRFENAVSIPLVDVDLLRVERGSELVLQAVMQTNARGVFAFAAPPDGRYTLAVGNPQHPLASTVVEITAGHALEKSFLLPNPVSLAVTVQYANGKPLTRGRVAIYAKSLGVYGSAALPLTETGQVLFQGLLPAEYHVQVDAIARETFEQAVEITQWHDVAVTITLP
ncbi:MAG: carboxypeptidase regulatory-like domain-containing protein [Planctomycetota bacterium]